MTARVGAFEPRGLYPSVNLGARHARVPEQLLDAPEIRAAVQQVRREAVSERVRRGGAITDPPHAFGPRPQPAPHVARTQRPAALAQEQGIGEVRGRRRERWATALEV